MKIVIGLDIGTSGIRAQAIKLETKKTLSTSITLRHPLPGSNVMDHLDFCMNNGLEVGRRVVIRAIEEVLRSLDIDLKSVERVAVCGNPIQLSIFQGIEIRDLAYAGDNALARMGISRLDRRATVLHTGELGIHVLKPDVEVYIPPAVAHMIGADAIAMIYKAGILNKRETSIVTDYGTNAEMALINGDEIYTGSAAAGPAIEGQQIEKGMLASPGTISDINFVDNNLKTTVLDNSMMGKESYLTDGRSGTVSKLRSFITPVGITGTGVIALVYSGIRAGLIKLPRIDTLTRTIKLYYDTIYFTEKDLEECGKAFGAFRAGHLTLLKYSGLSMNEIKSAYMAGAGGTYVDPIKAQDAGLVPPKVERIYQIGNTSLAFACDIAKDTSLLEEAQEIAERLKKTHIMFALEKDFKNAYIVELGYWRGMPNNMYKKFIKQYGLPEVPEEKSKPEIHRIAVRDIPVLGIKGLHIVKDLGVKLTAEFEGCTGCLSCVKACLEGALKVTKVNGHFKVEIRSDMCDGIACSKCENACTEKVFDYSKLVVKD